MKITIAQASCILWLDAATVEDTVRPRELWLANVSFRSLLRRGLAVCEPTPTDLWAVNLTDAGRALVAVARAMVERQRETRPARRVAGVTMAERWAR